LEFGDFWKHLNKCVKSMHSFRSALVLIILVID